MLAKPKDFNLPRPLQYPNAISLCKCSLQRLYFEEVYTFVAYKTIPLNNIWLLQGYLAIYRNHFLRLYGRL